MVSVRRGISGLSVGKPARLGLYVRCVGAA
ncbi:hypothetical protein FRACA_720003 [Frankia canadensis]|uniref:Uncharacterized protein n=1 Tax=Frankia canadensis TaxID=1836972 RepID=A0A2I2L0Q0_9ACTN|nr:hypothetical protein FRACA_720003 [Frankia canadensis]SOU58792.1 hypothetical protein FRACA_720003 [Frankia canadensis]